jgi:hypothetical protein
MRLIAFALPFGLSLMNTLNGANLQTCHTFVIPEVHFITRLECVQLLALFLA